MGHGNWSPRDYSNFQRSTAGKSTDQIYQGRELHKDLNPFGVQVRESRDSASNPKSTPIIVGIDVTGSMGFLADEIARKGLGTLFEAILDKKPVTDPHLMFMGIGDARTDRAPLQVSQFEADARIIEQLTNIWIEHGGGGNDGESYQLPWYFAAMHTVHDAWERRSRKGYLFTIGDEPAPVALTPSQVQRVCGDTIERDLSPEDLLALAQRTYHCFHLVIEEHGYAASDPNRVYSTWRRLMPERLISLKDHTKLAEVIVSVIALWEGQFHAVNDLWDDTTQRVVQHATKGLKLLSKNV